MPINRRELLGAASSVLALSGIAGSTSSAATAPATIKAIAFDGFPIFDPRPIFALAEELFPGRGAELSNAWRIRQFEYTWLRTVAQRYRDFLGVIDDALVFAGHSLNLDIPDEKRKALVDGYLHMKAWPDVVPVLSKLKEAGIRLAFLNNFTPAMLDANIRGAGLEGFLNTSSALMRSASTSRTRAPTRWASTPSVWNARKSCSRPLPAGMHPARNCLATRRSGSIARNNRWSSWTLFLTVKEPA
jgi:2-haloalkanoic acid dehalogenase type II